MYKPKIYENNVPVFTREDFFRDNESVYIQLSDEFKEYVGIVHKHEFIEIVYIISGRATHIVDGKSYQVKKGDISVINRKEEHCFFADEEYEEKFIAYDLMFTTDFLNNDILSGEDFVALSKSFLFYSLFPDENGYIPRLNLVENCNFEFGSIFDKIYYEYKNRTAGYINLIRVYTAELIIKIFRKIESSEKGILSHSQREIVKSVIDYIKTNYNISIRMEDISSKLFFNKNYIGKLFKQETGMTPVQYIASLRYEKSAHLLRHTDMPISEIAQAVGFSDTLYFSRFFHEFAGRSPSAFRKADR